MKPIVKKGQRVTKGSLLCEGYATENGELAGYLYMPRGVDADNPAPAVILTHGYLNNAEMQEIGGIELSMIVHVNC